MFWIVRFKLKKKKSIKDLKMKCYKAYISVWDRSSSIRKEIDYTAKNNADAVHSAKRYALNLLNHCYIDLNSIRVFTYTIEPINSKGVCHTSDKEFFSWKCYNRCFSLKQKIAHLENTVNSKYNTQICDHDWLPIECKNKLKKE